MPAYSQMGRTALLDLCKKFPDSEQAHAIWQEMVDGKSHIMVNALAGVGKTFTAMEGIRPIASTRSVQYLAFNKPIQVEASKKIPAPAQASTFNSAGFKACLAQWPFLRSSPNAVNADRTWQMLPDNMPATTKGPIVKLVALCKNTLTDPTRNNLLDLAAQYDIDLYSDSGGDFVDTILQWVPQIMERSKTPTPDLGIDFNDQVWLPVVWQLPVRTFDMVIVDEAQDLNNARRALARMLVGSRGRLVFIGDPHQAIYGFAGSDYYSMQHLADELTDTPFGLVTLPLTVTRRCPLLVTALARRIVPQFECLPTAPTGFVCLGDSYLVANAHTRDEYLYDTVKYPEETVVLHDPSLAEAADHECNDKCLTSVVPGKCANPEPAIGDMVLCRTNGPLVKLAYSLIRANVPVKIQGRDIGTNLATLIKKLVPSSATVPELEDAIAIYNNKETAKILKLGAGTQRAETALQLLDDKVQCLTALCEGLKTTQEVLSRISVLFADVEKGNTQGFVLCSSVHKAKGLESRVVRIIEPDLLPHPMAKLPWQKEQEMNLKYVAITRSLDTLHIH